jgi:hypothetical protein
MAIEVEAVAGPQVVIDANVLVGDSPGPTGPIGPAGADGRFKTEVKVASTANLTLSGAQTIDGVSCIAGDLVLVKDQTVTAQNGVYLVAAGAWAVQSSYTDCTFVIQQGTVNGGAIYSDQALGAPVGVQGPQGIQGIQGATGAQGPIGVGLVVVNNGASPAGGTATGTIVLERP